MSSAKRHNTMSAICPLEPALNPQYWFCPEAELYPTVLLWVPGANPATAHAQTWPLDHVALSKAPGASGKSEQDAHRPFR